MTDRRKSYRWLFQTNVYKSSVDKAIRVGAVKTKTEYAMQLWFAYLNRSWKFEEHEGLMWAFKWSESPQGHNYWSKIEHG